MQPDTDCFDYHPGFLAPQEADACLRVLWNELQWSQREILLFGRRVMQPRLIAWYGEPSVTYRYSGLALTAIPWHPLLAELKSRIERFTGGRFNSVLANAYRDGGDSMGWHRDDERELGDQPILASLSLGAGRRFLVREDGRPSAGLTLENGSLLVMKGDSQSRYRHALPKTRRPVGLRINLTYRFVSVTN